MGNRKWVWCCSSQGVGASALLFILSTAPVVGSCSKSKTFNPLDAGNAGDTGDAGNARDAGDAERSSSFCDGGACEDQTRDVSVGNDEGDQGEQDSGSLSSDGDAEPTPPDYCVAPCVWEVVRRCIPDIRQCVSETVPGLEVVCDPSTGWYAVSFYVNSTTEETNVGHNGALCVSFRRDYSMGSNVVIDSSGKTVALKDVHDAVYCGNITDIDLYEAERTDAGAELANDGGFVPAYHLDTDRAECSAWDWHGFPVANSPPRYFDNCQVADAGTCGLQ
jgi:hypothetical protein